MKGKLLLSLAIASLVSANSFALEIYKGKLVKHQEWTTGGAKGFFKSGVVKSSFKSHVMSGHKNSEPYMEASSITKSMKTFVDVPTIVSGEHQVFMNNDSDASQTFTYSLSLCAEVSANQTRCVRYYDELTLEPGGYAISSAEPVLSEAFVAPGTYEIFSQVLVANKYPTSDMTAFTSVSTSRSTVEVAASKG